MPACGPQLRALASVNAALSPFELERAERIKMLQKRMDEMGLNMAAQSFQSAVQGEKREQAARRKSWNSPKVPRLRQAVKRRSGRLAGQDAINYNENVLANADPPAGCTLSQRALLAGRFNPSGHCPEVYNAAHVQALGTSEENWDLFVDGFCQNTGKRVYDPVNGVTCHQCRQKTVGLRTTCSNCESLHGQFCGDCLFMRYGENVKEALADPSWTCPCCRDLCNCSIHRNRRGWSPTGSMFRAAESEGYCSVAHCILLNNLDAPTLAAIKASTLAVPGGYPDGWATTHAVPLHSEIETPPATATATGASATAAAAAVQSGVVLPAPVHAAAAGRVATQAPVANGAAARGAAPTRSQVAAASAQIAAHAGAESNSAAALLTGSGAGVAMEEGEAVDEGAAMEEGEDDAIRTDEVLTDEVLTEEALTDKVLTDEVPTNEVAGRAVSAPIACRPRCAATRASLGATAPTNSPVKQSPAQHGAAASARAATAVLQSVKRRLKSLSAGETDAVMELPAPKRTRRSTAAAAVATAAAAEGMAAVAAAEGMAGFGAVTHAALTAALSLAMTDAHIEVEVEEVLGGKAGKVARGGAGRGLNGDVARGVEAALALRKAAVTRGQAAVTDTMRVRARRSRA